MLDKRWHGIQRHHSPAWAIVAAILVVAPAALALDTEGAQRNIAINRTYDLDPKPNYPHCTDANDDKDLTDGKLSPGRIWTQKSTVGWVSTPSVQVTIDLGRAQPIAGMSFSTAAGIASVVWPTAIHILVSDDGKSFFDAGDLVELSNGHVPPANEGYVRHRFLTDKVATHGRYVRLLVVAGGPFIFSDEVAIYRGDDALLVRGHHGNAIVDAGVFLRQRQVRSAMIRRIVSDAKALGTLLTAAPLSSGERLRLESERAAAIEEARELPEIDVDSFRTTLPLNGLHARLFRTQAAAWRAAGSAPVMAWHSPLWDPLSLTGPLPQLMPPARLHVRLMNGEYRAAAFNLSNATDRDLTLRLHFEKLPALQDPPWVTVHEVAWTDTKHGQAVASALPEARRDGREFAIFVPSGMTRQVWLTFHPVDIAPGEHVGSVVVRGDGLKDIVVPLNMQISPLRFPARPRLQLGGWDYTDRDRFLGVTPENRDAFLAHLREHFVDTPWATSSVMPAVPDFTQLDTWLQRWPTARSYRVFLNVGDSFSGARMGTPAFEKKVGAWISAYTTHLRRRGLKTEQLGLLLVDEPSDRRRDEIIIAWAKAIRAAEPNLVIWENPTHKDPLDARTMLRACDVLCPNRPMFLTDGPAFREVFAQQRAAGKTLNFYSCSGPVQTLDPYSYHRLQAWTSWREGATGEFFWAFGDNGGGSTWNEYSTPGTNYTPLFLDDRTVTPAKHMEAIREGVEDYEYLAMLGDRIAQLERAGNVSSALSAAKNLLATTADRVLDAPGAGELRWASQKDRTVADTVRLAVLEALEDLEALRLPP